MAAGLVLLAVVAGDPSRLTTAIGLVVFGLGFGMVGQILITAVQNDVNRRMLGVATAATSFFRGLGGAVGAALLGAVFAARVGAGTAAEVADAVRVVFLAGAGIAVVALGVVLALREVPLRGPGPVTPGPPRPRAEMTGPSCNWPRAARPIGQPETLAHGFEPLSHGASRPHRLDSGHAIGSSDRRGSMDERFTLVLGGTGKTGRRVAERLWARGLPVLIGSRSGTPPFDWEDRTTWAPALRGARAAYVSYYPDLAAPGAPEAVGALAAEAAAAGVERLVLLSGRGEEEAQRSEAHGRRGGRGPDRGAGELVRPELQRGLPARARPGRRGGPAGGRRARAVHRRQRHRRRRRRGADRGRTRRRRLRGDRPPGR